MEQVPLQYSILGQGPSGAGGWRKAKEPKDWKHLHGILSSREGQRPGAAVVELVDGLEVTSVTLRTVDFKAEAEIMVAE